MSVKDGKGKVFLKDLPDESDVDKVVRDTMERLGKVAVKAYQNEVRRSSWNRTPTTLINSFKYEVKPDGTLHVSSDHPAATYLNKGVRSHTMDYLQNAKRPIPIITDSGEVVYRTPSFQSMNNGQWRHPGISGKHFLERGQEKAQKAVKEELAEVYKDLFRKALKG